MAVPKARVPSAASDYGTGSFRRLRPAPVGGVPDPSEWRHVVPWGVWLIPGPVATRDPNTASGATTDRTISDVTGFNGLFAHPEQGLAPNGFDSVLYGFVVPKVVVDEQQLPVLYDTRTEHGGRVLPVYWPTGRTAVDPNTGIDYEWFQTAGTTNPNDYATARAIADNLFALYGDSKKLANRRAFGFAIKDDVKSGQNQPDATLTMCRAMQDADPQHRPCLFTHIEPNLRNLWAEAGADLKAALTYRYPCGRYVNNTDTQKGDFHRSTFSTVPDLGGGGGDWIDALRQWHAYLPVSNGRRARVLHVAQGHRTVGGTNTDLRYPFDEEYGMMTAILVGEGVTGIWWLGADRNAGTWDGFLEPTRRSALEALKKVGGRFKKIRDVLLGCEKETTARFSAAGGGSSGYPVNYANAYASTLRDVATGRYYLVLLNRSASAAAITVSGINGPSGGRLVNVEDGTAVKLGGSVTLPAFDWAFYRYEPPVGLATVLVKGVVAEDRSIRDAWDTHWVNPAAPNHVPVGGFSYAPRVVQVGGSDLLADAIRAYGGETKYELAAGYVSAEELYLYNPEPGYTPGLLPAGAIAVPDLRRMHFVSANPANKATVWSLTVMGSAYATQINGTGGSPAYGFPAHLNTIRADRAVYDWLNPPGDLIFKDLIFAPPAAPLNLIHFPWFTIDGANNRDQRTRYQPFFGRNLDGVLFEGCVFQGYEAADALPAPPGDQTPTKVGAIDPYGHCALIAGNAGVSNWTVRDCTLSVPADTRGLPHVVFLDGARNCCLYNNVANPVTGKIARSYVLLLTNDDFNQDHRFVGQVRAEDGRNARGNFIVGNSWNAQCQPAAYQVTGQQNLVKGNIAAAGTTTLFTAYIEVAVKCSRQWKAHSHRLFNYGNWVEGETVNKNVTTFLVYLPDEGYTNCVGDATIGNPYKSRCGKTTLKDNIVTGTVTTPIAVKAGQNDTADGPDTQIGNSWP